MQQLWAYAYRVIPPPAAPGLNQLRRLLDNENAAAFEHARAWAAQLILEQRSTQILVVSDSPAQNRAVNRRVESELQRLRANYRLTDPIAIRGPAHSTSGAEQAAIRPNYSSSMG
ncbi:MAG TPA: hypothetical protein VG454_04405 [Gemmatimonadales bacterium]|nr:hypothetical protein [Gemmatimonadales bacterium]